MDKKTYRIDEVAEIFQVSPRTVWREIERKRLDVIHFGKQVRVEKQAIEAYEKKNVTDDDA